MSTTDAPSPPANLIAEVRRLDAAATPGPWEADGDHVMTMSDEDITMTMWRDEDAAFIARARTLLPVLADALEATHAERERLRERLFERALRAEDEVTTLRVQLDESKDRAQRRTLAGSGKAELTDDEILAVAVEEGAITAEQRAALQALTGDERTLLTPAHDGHVFAGTWEQFAPLSTGAPCAACGLPIAVGRAPCPGWSRRASEGDALRRVVRAITREAPDDQPNGAAETAVLRFSEALNRLLDLVDADKGDGSDERCAAAQTAAQRLVLLLGTLADQDRALEHALEASNPHAALRAFMAGVPSTDMTREAVEKLADVIRVRMREVATFALAWRDIVREHSRYDWTAFLSVEDALARLAAIGARDAEVRDLLVAWTAFKRGGERVDEVPIVAGRETSLDEEPVPSASTGSFMGRGMVDPHGVLARDLMRAHLNAPTIPAPPPGLVETLAASAAEHKPDVVLHALHVAGGAAAIDVTSIEIVRQREREEHPLLTMSASTTEQRGALVRAGWCDNCPHRQEATCPDPQCARESGADKRGAILPVALSSSTALAEGIALRTMADVASQMVAQGDWQTPELAEAGAALARRLNEEARVLEVGRTPEIVLRAMLDESLRAWSDAEVAFYAAKDETAEEEAAYHTATGALVRVHALQEALGFLRAERAVDMTGVVMADYEARLSGARPLDAPPLEAP